MLTKLKAIAQELFYFFSILIFVFLIMELIWPNIILAYFNITYLIIAWLAMLIVLLV